MTSSDFHKKFLYLSKDVIECFERDDYLARLGFINYIDDHGVEYRVPSVAIYSPDDGVTAAYSCRYDDLASLFYSLMVHRYDYAKRKIMQFPCSARFVIYNCISKL